MQCQISTCSRSLLIAFVFTISNSAFAWEIDKRYDDGPCQLTGANGSYVDHDSRVANYDACEAKCRANANCTDFVFLSQPRTYVGDKWSKWTCETCKPSDPCHRIKAGAVRDEKKGEDHRSVGLFSKPEKKYKYECWINH